MTPFAESAGTYQEPCPFCRIANGEDPDVISVAEEADWMAFLPPEPATPGHTLIIPRMHVPDFWALDPDLACTLTGAAEQIGKAVRCALQPDGLNLITSAGTAAEQTVFHVHLHVVPRWRRDGFGHIWPKSRETSTASLSRTAEALRKALRA